MHPSAAAAGKTSLYSNILFCFIGGQISPLMCTVTGVTTSPMTMVGPRTVWTFSYMMVCGTYLKADGLVWITVVFKISFFCEVWSVTVNTKSSLYWCTLIPSVVMGIFVDWEALRHCAIIVHEKDLKENLPCGIFFLQRCLYDFEVTVLWRMLFSVYLLWEVGMQYFGTYSV